MLSAISALLCPPLGCRLESSCSFLFSVISRLSPRFCRPGALGLRLLASSALLPSEGKFCIGNACILIRFGYWLVAAACHPMAAECCSYRGSPLLRSVYSCRATKRGPRRVAPWTDYSRLLRAVGLGLPAVAPALPHAFPRVATGWFQSCILSDCSRLPARWKRLFAGNSGSAAVWAVPSTHTLCAVAADMVSTKGHTPCHFCNPLGAVAADMVSANWHTPCHFCRRLR